MEILNKKQGIIYLGQGAQPAPELHAYYQLNNF
jgi:hypothetical protein